MGKIKDIVGNECEEAEMLELEGADEEHFNKICPKTRTEALENLDHILKGFSILENQEKTENLLVALKPEERSKLYNSNIYDFKISDLLP